jgi:hypothetical protein
LNFGIFVFFLTRTLDTTAKMEDSTSLIQHVVGFIFQLPLFFSSQSLTSFSFPARSARP